jgi:hypothetical protein
MKLISSLLWIVGSMLIVPGTVYRLMAPKEPHVDYLCRIVQTGPQKEALKTPFLAELIDLSADRPVLAKQFDPILARRRLRASPVIKDATVQVIKPDTVYIDYTVRQPIAALFEFDNVALDDEGTPFPIVPFFSPKKLPELVLDVKTMTWGIPLKNEKTELALSLLKLLHKESLHVLKLDVTAAFAPSLGKREIVVTLQENGFSKYLRLTPKNYAQELGNYLELRKTLPPETQVIDLRIPQLAFIDKT